MIRTTTKFFAVSALALALAACSGSGDGNKGTDKAAPTDVKIAQVAPPAGKKWEDMVEKTADGGFRIGNPDAKVKVIEYASLTCSHCAEFSKEAFEPMKAKYISSGQVSFEMRNFARDIIDASAAAITHCVGAERYYPLTENVFASQEELFQGAQSADQAAAKQAESLPADKRIGAIAKVVKLDQFFKARGVTEAEFNTCLADTNNISALEKISKDGNDKFQITGTPTFIIDGKKTEFGADKTLWESLQTVLNEKLG